MHPNQLIKEKIQNALTTLFEIPFESGACFQDLDFEDTTSEKYHLDVMWEFADVQKVIYHGVHLTAHLKSQAKHALATGFTIGNKVCAICKIEGKHIPCLINRKGQVVEPLDTGLDVGSDVLNSGILYGWYIFKRKKI